MPEPFPKRTPRGNLAQCPIFAGERVTNWTPKDTSTANIDLQERCAATAMTDMWAPATWGTRLRLQEQFRRDGVTTPIQAVASIHKNTLSVQSKLTMARAAKTLYKGHRLEKAISMYMRSLSCQGALEPLKQARPATYRDICVLVKTLQSDVGATALLAWKTASRWTEVATLTRKKFIEVTPTRMIISWGRSPKAAKANPYRMDMYTVVQGRGTPIIYARVMHLRGSTPMTRCSTAQLNRMLKRLLGNGYSSHSIKRGAVTTLMEKVSRGELTLEMVARLAKHKDVISTIRYAGSQKVTALALGTGDATRLL